MVYVLVCDPHHADVLASPVDASQGGALWLVSACGLCNDSRPVRPHRLDYEALWCGADVGVAKLEGLRDNLYRSSDLHFGINNGNYFVVDANTAM